MNPHPPLFGILTPASPPLYKRSCSEADPNGGGFISYAAFQAALSSASVELQEQALITIMRKWHAADAKQPAVAYKEFLAQL